MTKKPTITHFVKWAPIKDFPNYFVSNTGVVRHLGRILTVSYSEARNRPYVILKSTWKPVPREIHRLVFFSFTETEKIKGYEVHHIDGDYLNNHIDNLEYISRREHIEKHVKMNQMKKEVANG